MSMNCVEKIFAKHAELKEVTAGDIIDAKVDWIMVNDATAALTSEIFKDQFKATRVWNPNKVVVFIDHYSPCNSIASAEYHQKMRKFAQEQGIKNFFDSKGICHQIMLEKFVLPGQLVIGADSHTCSYGSMGAVSTGMGSTDIAAAWIEGKTWFKVPETIKFELKGRLPKGVFSKDIILKIIGDLTVKGATYKAMEFTGSAVNEMSIAARTTMCNMAIEAGGKCAYIQPDDKVVKFLKFHNRENEKYESFQPDSDAQYQQIIEYDIEKSEPQIACPHTVDNVKPLSSLEGLEINEAFIGACTNGRLEDLEIAANILKGKKINPKVRLLVTPASEDVYRNALDKGIIKILLDAGAVINHPSCSACYGAIQGVLGPDERLISSANRNFKGRVGSPDSEIYLGSPATVAASAIHGKITDPREVI